MFLFSGVAVSLFGWVILVITFCCDDVTWRMSHPPKGLICAEYRVSWLLCTMSWRRARWKWYPPIRLTPLGKVFGTVYRGFESFGKDFDVLSQMSHLLRSLICGVCTVSCLLCTVSWLRTRWRWFPPVRPTPFGRVFGTVDRGFEEDFGVCGQHNFRIRFFMKF